MGYHDHRVLKIDQELLQPGDGVQIQMVGRLVEQQDVRVAKQSLGQQHLHLLGAGQGIHLGVVELRLDAQAVQQVLGVGLRLPAVHGGELTLQLGGLHAVLLGEVLLHVDGFLLLHDLVQPGVAHNHRVQNRVLVVFKVVLLKKGETLSRRDGDLAAGRLQLTGQNSQKCGLAGAVGSDQAVAVALGELDVHILKQCLFPHPEGYVVCTNHNTYLSFCLFFNRFPAPSKNALRSRPGGPAGHFQVRVCALMKKGVCRPLFSSISDCTGKTLNLQGFFRKFPIPIQRADRISALTPLFSPQRGNWSPRKSHKPPSRGPRCPSSGPPLPWGSYPLTGSAPGCRRS